MYHYLLIFGFNGCFLIHEKLNMILICYTGINKTDITSLESYTVYSQSKAKTASRFYIMKCSQLINLEFIQPIKSLIERFISIAIIFSLADSLMTWESQRVNGIDVVGLGCYSDGFISSLSPETGMSKILFFIQH